MSGSCDGGNDVSGPPATIAFDCGETLVDETGQWTAWASWLGVPPFTLMVTLGAVLERGRPFKEVFQLFDETFDIDTEIERRRREGTGYSMSEQDLHPDVRPALHALSDAGFRLVVAGTMTEAERGQFRSFQLPVDEIVSHADLGRRNADPAFFSALAARIHRRPGQILYVSHRLDTAVVAARQAGVPVVYLVRGPIARLRLGTEADSTTRNRVASLWDLVRLVA